MNKIALKLVSCPVNQATRNFVKAKCNINFLRNLTAIPCGSTCAFSFPVPKCNFEVGNMCANVSVLSSLAKRSFSTSRDIRSRSREPEDTDATESYPRSVSLSEAVKEELKFVGSATEGSFEIPFPLNWTIQKLGAKVIMTKNSKDNSGAHVRVSFSVNSVTDQEVSESAESDLSDEESSADIDQAFPSEEEVTGEAGEEEFLDREEGSTTIPHEILIEIKKNNKILSIEADIDSEGPVLRSLSFNKSKNTQNTDEYETFEVNFETLSLPVQDALFTYLEELGLTEDFFANLLDWSLNYEQSLFVGFLNEMKNFSE